MLNYIMTRLWSLDILRIVSMAAVVLLHTSAQFWSTADVSSFDWEVLNFYDSAVRWAVPVFVMISDALFLDPGREQSIRKLYAKNISRICLIILFWGFLYALIYQQPEGTSIKEVWAFCKSGLLGHYHMWFLFMILGLYVVTPVLRCVTRDESVTKYFLVVAFMVNTLIPFITSFGHLSILAEMLSKVQFHVPMGYAFYYVLGFWLNKRSFTVKQKRYLLMMLLAGILLTFVLTAYVSLASGKALQTFYGYFSLPVLMASVGVFALGKGIKLRAPKAQRIVSALSTAALGVYMLHVIVLDQLHALGFDSMMFSPVVAVPLTALAAIAISYIISIALNKIPVFKNHFV